MSLWQYTAMVQEHNSRQDTEIQVQPWTAEEYKAQLEAYREMGDPTIQV